MLNEQENSPSSPPVAQTELVSIKPLQIGSEQASRANSQLLPWTLGKGVVRECSFIELGVPLLKWV